MHDISHRNKKHTRMQCSAKFRTILLTMAGKSGSSANKAIQQC